MDSDISSMSEPQSSVSKKMSSIFKKMRIFVDLITFLVFCVTVSL